MKAKLKNILGLAALGMTLLTNTVPTWAGYVQNQAVVVRTSPYPAYGYGNMVDARYSADNNQAIGCYVGIGAVDASPSITCIARNSAGNSISCGSTDPVYVEIVQGMTDSSDIYFELAPATGRCANLTIYNGSIVLR